MAFSTILKCTWTCSNLRLIVHVTTHICPRSRSIASPSPFSTPFPLKYSMRLYLLQQLFSRWSATLQCCGKRVWSFVWNTLSFRIVLRHRKMRTVTNYYLLNLAIADISISIFNTGFSWIYNFYYHWMWVFVDSERWNDHPRPVVSCVIAHRPFCPQPFVQFVKRLQQRLNSLRCDFPVSNKFIPN